MQKPIDVDMYIRGYKARQQYRQRRKNKQFVKDYLKALAIGIVALPVLWIIAVGILSI